jgi:branched-chain amino acid transport system substrate-binding protein
MLRKEISMNVKLRVVLLAAVAGATALFLAGRVIAAGPAAPAGSTEKELKVGIDVALTGGAAPWGKHAWNVYQLLFDEINAGGGLACPKGTKINYRVMDHQSKPDVAQAVAERLADWGAPAIFGTNQSDSALTAQAVAERRRVLFIDTSDADQMITERGFKYTFRTAPSNVQLGPAAIEFVKDVQQRTGVQSKAVAILTSQTAGGEAIRKSWLDVVPKAGFNLVDNQSYPLTTVDYTPIFRRFKSKNVDLLFVTSFTADAILINRGMKQADFNPIAFVGVNGGYNTNEYIQQVGKDADYTLLINWFSPDLRLPNLKPLIEKYKRRFNVEFESADATAANGISVFVDAVERACSTETERIRQALQQTDLKAGQRWYVVPDGAKFDQTGQNIKQKVVGLQIQKGQFVGVWPYDYAAGKVVWPIPAWKDR